MREYSLTCCASGRSSTTDGSCCCAAADGADVAVDPAAAVPFPLETPKGAVVALPLLAAAEGAVDPNAMARVGRVRTATTMDICLWTTRSKRVRLRGLFGGGGDRDHVLVNSQCKTPKATTMTSARSDTARSNVIVIVFDGKESFVAHFGGQFFDHGRRVPSSTTSERSFQRAQKESRKLGGDACRAYCV